MPRRRRTVSEILVVNDSDRIVARSSGSARSISFSEIIFGGDSEDENDDHEGLCLSDDHARLVPTRQMSIESLHQSEGRWKYLLGVLMAFISGMTVTLNNAIVKQLDSDFGEVLAVRALVQIPLMGGIILFKGHSFVPASKTLTVLVGIFGATQILCTYACVRFMPVADAMTLIFTSPLFTIILAAIFLKHKLSAIKFFSAISLMVGIILVTQPPFLFPSGLHRLGFMATDLINDFISPQLLEKVADTFQPESQEYNRTLKNYSDEPPTDYLYFVGAGVALGSSMSSAANNILMAKLGRRVPTSVQLFYIGIFGAAIALASQFTDPRDRFFTPRILEITIGEFGIYVGIALIGISGFFCMIRSLSLIVPSTVATLRTSQIIFAFLVQIGISGEIPGLYDSLGSGIIFLAVVAITFESAIIRLIKNVWQGLKCTRKDDEEE